MTQKPALLISLHFKQLLESAADYYMRHAGTDVATSLLDAVEQAVGYIAENPRASMRYIPPEGFPEFESLHYRVFNLRSSSPFPYSIYYETDKESIVIHALYHHSQNREAYLAH